MNVHNKTTHWKSELQQMSFRYHTLIATVAVILNPLWVIGDALNIPDHFKDFFIFRCVVSLLTLAVLFLRHKLKGFPELIALVPFIGISIQNAYMYSVMDAASLQKHTFAYIALFIGAGMFVVWKPIYSILVVLISLIANLVCFSYWGQLETSEVLTNGGMLTLSVALFTILLIQTRTTLIKKEIIARLELTTTNRQLAENKRIIEEKNRDIYDSLMYSKRIQQAILPTPDRMNAVLPEYFVIYEPKDIVSGDFYWIKKLHTTPTPGVLDREFVVIAAVDCTGHGVPGALMSSIGSTILQYSASQANINSPADALNFLNHEISKNLTSIRDGMDIALCAIDFENKKLQFAGANNPMYIIRKGEVLQLKPDKLAIGNDHDHADEKKFTNHQLDLESGDCLYLFTDGYADQFGGPNGKKFKYNMFRRTLTQIHHLPMDEQKKQLLQRFQHWKGSLDQVDDVCVIGVRIP